MINTIDKYNEMFNSVAREFVGRVELLEGSTLLNTFEHDGVLRSFVIEKIGDNTRFFGYGICQKATVKLVDRERTINVIKGQGLQIAHGIGTDYIYTYPVFYVDEVIRDENTNELTIIGYDAIYKASSHTVSEVVLPETYTLASFIYAAAAVLGMPVSFENVSSTLLNLDYNKSLVNVEGTESLREVLDDVAEVLGAIYYLNDDWELTFKTLKVGSNPVLQIDKSKYFTLSAKPAFTLQSIVSTTELGDNIAVSADSAGETQYLRDNVFLTLRNDIADILDITFTLVAGLTIYPFDCKHRGDFRLELGDKIGLTTKDNSVIHTYILDDTITYNGGLVGQLRWDYAGGGSASTPSTVGEILSQTYAKVDKVNKRIDLVASQVDEYSEEISQLTLTTDAITASVQKTNQAITNLTEMQITEEDVSIKIQESWESNEAIGVRTATNFTFNESGLSIVKSNSKFATHIDEDGMSISESGRTVLTADHKGVQAQDLHATTYLVIGNNSRFEDYEGSRTGCFWIGG